MRAPKDKPSKRRAWVRSIVRVSSTVLVCFALFWWWLPWEFRPDASQVRLPASNLAWSDLANPSMKILVITAHPDDSEFYIGGTLARLHESRVPIELLIVTNGDKSYYPFGVDPGLAKIRQAEQTEVAGKWGASRITFLGEPDGRFEPTRELEDRIEAKIRAIQPDIVLTFDPEFPLKVAHGDHRKAGVAGLAAAKRADVPLVLLFATMAPSFTVDISRHYDQKLSLLSGHKSQFDETRMGHVEGMLWDAAESAGQRIGVELGENFRVVR